MGIESLTKALEDSSYQVVDGCSSNGASRSREDEPYYKLWSRYKKGDIHFSPRQQKLFNKIIKRTCDRSIRMQVIIEALFIVSSTKDIEEEEKWW